MNQRKIICVAMHELSIKTLKHLAELTKKMIVSPVQDIPSLESIYPMEEAEKIADAFMKIPGITKELFDECWDTIDGIILAILTKMLPFRVFEPDFRGIMFDGIANHEIKKFNDHMIQHLKECELSCIKDSIPWRYN